MDRVKESVIETKTYSFSLRIVEMYKQLGKQKEFVLAKQLLRSGTSIGANVHEAVGAYSKRDFVYRLVIAVREAREVFYWLRLLKDSEYISVAEFQEVSDQCREILRILNSIILTTKERYLK